MIALLVLLLTLLLALFGSLAVVVSPLFFSAMVVVFLVMAYAGVKSTLPVRENKASTGRVDETRL